MYFKTSIPDTYFEDTGFFKVHNYPPQPNTFSYITRTYWEYKKNRFGWEEVDGEPQYFHDLPTEILSLAIIMGTAQNALASLCKYEKSLTPIESLNL